MTKRWIVLALALAFAATGAFAQETTTGSIVGAVTDAQGGSIPGATVTLTSNQGTKTFVTDSNGRFFAPFLTVGSYDVKVELAGFSTVERKAIQVRLGQRIELDFTLKVGDVAETIEVVGETPVIDTNSTTAGGILDADAMKRLPVGRSLADTLYLVPGVSDSSGVGRANPSIGGGSGLENNYVVDGVNITDVGFGGVGNFNPQFGSLGVGVTSDFVKETQVKTAGFEAEYGQATGGVVNVVTRSGGNRFAGSVFGYFRPGALESSWEQGVAPNGLVNTTEREEYDFGVSLGGPLVKDKVFFYATFNPQFQNRSFIAPEGFPYRSLGDVQRKRKIYSYAGKLTFQATSNHRFDVSAFGDPSTGEAGLQRFSTLRRRAYPGAPGTSAIEGGFSELDYGGHNQTLRYDGIISPNWLIEASVARVSNKFDEIAALDDYLYTDLRFVPNGASGGLGYHERDKGKNLQFTLKSTNIFQAAGNHQLRYGVQYEDIEFTRDVDYSGAPLALADGQTTNTRGKLSPTAATDQKYLNFFIQDTWQIGRLTLRPGIRWESQELTGVPPGNGQPELCFEGDTRPGAGDGTGSAIPCTFTWDNLWAPRIGATFDLFGNGRSKIFASWGRFYAKIPNDLAARAMSADAGITRQDYQDAALTQPVPNGVNFAGGTTHLLQSSPHAAIIDPDAGSTYKNEFIGGVEFEVGRAVNLGFRYIRRTMPQILEDIGELPVVGYFIDACGDAVVDYFITNVNASSPTVSCGGVIPSSFEDPTHTYDAFEVTLNKTFSDNWSLLASYRYSKLEGNFEGFFRSDNGQTDPAISSLFDFPTNDPSYTAIGVPEFGFLGDIRYQGTTLGQGVLPNDRPHQVKIYGNYTFGALNFGLGFNYGSGRSLTALAGNPAYANSGEIPLTLRGAGIETVDGFNERSPDEVQLDLHADYTVRINDTQRIVFLADVFNLFNRQEPTDYDNYVETSVGAPNPNFGFPTAGGAISQPSFQAPLALRLGARFEW
jgi:Carboxypeptidase regulatory-like domain/TonB-dependent Receptor Plug Domain